MREEGYISPRQASVLLWFAILPTAILFLPALLTLRARQDSWLAVILATLAAGIPALVIYLLALRFPHYTLFQYCELILGHLAGKIVAMVFVLAFFLLNAVVIREFSEFLTTAVMPETPFLFFACSIVTVAVYAARNGLEVIARCTDFIMPLLVAFFVVILLFATPEMSLRNILPFLENGIRPVLGGSLITWPFMGQVIILATYGAFVNPPRSLGWSLISGLLGIAFFLVLVTMGVILAFGASEATTLIFAGYNLARIVSLGQFLERIEVLFLAIWVAGVFIKIALNLYVVALGLATVTGLKEYQPLVAPLGALNVAMAAYMYRNISEIRLDLLTVEPGWTLTWQFILPLLLLLVAWVRGQRRTGA
ncbi:GerAB/ArcD/ProY family transporter [Neomoorella thermoacetica]|uniref:Spore germination protein n=1 Tax=Moorella thermoacetica Y72 TaxID=1325331 RepID=A0A0S6UD00_NEOTH|nr:endospore germination permease [Moorella thermoacetica]OIQ54762.1 spore germination protein YndE [Moorella thermoacetica]GAF25248.1 spore germination protein [Moorella thermoacetica Y72]